MEILGGLLGIWALGTMKLKNLSALPEVKPESVLLTTGPYRWIRHPMYTALLLVTLAVVLDAFSIGRGCVWLVLVIDLFLKLQFEETLLMQAFPEYRTYQRQTYRLIPWLL